MSDNSTSLKFLGNSHMGRQIAEQDWSKHPLGPISAWSPALRIALSTMLSSGFPCFLGWEESFYTFYNDAYLPVLGNKVALGQGRRLLTELWLEAAEATRSIIEQAFAGKTMYFENMPITVNRHGYTEQAYFTFSYSPVSDEEGDILAIFCTAIDVTEKVLTLARLQESEERYRLSLHASNMIGTWTIDQDTGRTCFDEQIGRLFEVDPALGKIGVDVSIFIDKIHPRDRHHVSTAISRSIETGTRYDVDFRICQQSGMDIWVTGKGKMFTSADPENKMLAGVCVDISDRKLAEQELIEAEKRSNFLLELADRLRPLTVPDDITAAASELLGTHLNVKRVLYAEVDEATGTFVSRQDWTRNGLKSIAGEVRSLDDFGPEVIGALRSGQSTVINDVAKDPRIAAHVDEYKKIGIGASLTIPFVRSGHLNVMLSLHQAEPYDWKKSDIQLTLDVAERTWAAAESARTNQLLRIERDRSQAVFDTMNEGFVMFDRAWKLLYMNAEGLRIAGRPDQELVGQNMWDIWPEYRGTQVEHLYRQAMQTREPSTLEIAHGYADRSTAWLEIRVYPGVDGGVSIFFRDVTSRRDAEEKLRDADRRKDEFLAMLAHELRNPLAPIGAAAQLLQLVKLDEERVRKTSAVIGRQVSHMTGLIDDLLDVSRVTRGLIELDKAALDIQHVVNDAFEQVGPLIRSREHELTMRLTPQLALVWGDKKRLVQVLANILNNAAKYTAEGGHLVLRTSVQDQEVLIEVSDDGIGMTPETAKHAFDLFAQAERSSDRSSGGLGLGLALVKSLVELHGGTVTCRSGGLGQGSTFSICLPRLVEQSQTDSCGVSENVALATPSASLKILVVDDNVDAAAMLKLLLEAMGHEVQVEHGALRALEQAKRYQPQVCLVDIGLPEVDGNEVARRLRAQPENAGVVLVAVTGYGQESDRASTLAAGFDHHLVKPVDTAALISILSAIKMN